MDENSETRKRTHVIRIEKGVHGSWRIAIFLPPDQELLVLADVGPRIRTFVRNSAVEPCARLGHSPNRMRMIGSAACRGQYRLKEGPWLPWTPELAKAALPG
jgi:hypothetical protein